MKNYLYIDVGYNTQVGKWFADFNDYYQRNAGYMLGNSIEIIDGTTFQAEWPDSTKETIERRNPFFHIRERIWSENIKNISIDSDDNIQICCVRGKEANSEPPTPVLDIDKNTIAIEIAYAIRTSNGFINFVDDKRNVIKQLLNKRIITENLYQKTVGTFPDIRLTTPVSSIAGLIVSGSTCIIVGK
jgi:hypothetical protein